MKTRLIISLLLLLLFTTYNPQNLPLKSRFNIQEIKIENNFILKDKEIKKDLISLYNTNLIFLNASNIKKNLIKKSFIESFEIKKIYPNKLKIKIFEKKPIAVLYFKNNKFLISDKFDLINYKDLNRFKNLPIVYSDKENFEYFYNKLKKINFPFNTIKKFYFFEAQRWDLETYNNKIIKLPADNYVKSLENFINLKKNYDKYKFFDYRINGQLILK
jgi:cell division protein FtsQ